MSSNINKGYRRKKRWNESAAAKEERATSIECRSEVKEGEPVLNATTWTLLRYIVYVEEKRRECLRDGSPTNLAENKTSYL
jgi:hypothetical protein